MMHDRLVDGSLLKLWIAWPSSAPIFGVGDMKTTKSDSIVAVVPSLLLAAYLLIVPTAPIWTSIWKLGGVVD